MIEVVMDLRQDAWGLGRERRVRPGASCDYLSFSLLPCLFRFFFCNLACSHSCRFWDQLRMLLLGMRSWRKRCRHDGQTSVLKRTLLETDLLDVRRNSSLTDGGLDERIELLVTSDGKLEMSREQQHK